MSWKAQFEEYEKYFGIHAPIDWKPAIELTRKVIDNKPNDPEVYIRVIYLLHNILVEEEYPESERDHMAKLLKQYFDESYKKFSENAEYLFFIGKILHIAEWYFGLYDNKLALEFQARAMEKEPGNLLFEWAYRVSCPGDIIVGYLAHQLIENEKNKVDWLKTKGFPGTYILEHLVMSHQEYLDNKARK